MQYHGSLRSWELGQAPMLLMFQNPRIEIVCLIGTLSTILLHSNYVSLPLKLDNPYYLYDNC